MEDVEKKFKTLMLFLIWICLGLFFEIGGPTMIDLKLRFHSSYASISWAVSATSLGHFLGALVGGVSVDMLGPCWQDMLVTVSQLLAVAAILTMPFVGDVGALWLLFFAMGTTLGVTDVAGQRILFKMWREKTPVPIHVIHLGLGIGATATPLIANNFLAKLKFEEPSGNSSVLLSSDQQPYTVIQASRVHLAYLTIGFVVALLCLPFFVYSLCECYQQLRRDDCANAIDYEHEQPKSMCETIRAMIDPATYTDGSRAFGIFLCILLMAFLMNVVGGEHMLGKFIRTFSIDAAHFSRDDASYLDTAYWASFSFGRLISSVLADNVSTLKLLIVTTLCNTIIGITFPIYTAKSHATLWTFTVLSGLSFGPLYPAYVAYTNTHIDIGGVVLVLISFSSGLGSMIYMGVTGSLYDYYGPRALLYVVSACCLLSLLIIIVLSVGTYKRVDRFRRPLSEDTGLLTKESVSDDKVRQD